MTTQRRIFGALAAILLASLAFSGALAQDATPEALEPSASPVAATDCASLLGIGTAEDGCLILIDGLDGAGPIDLYIDQLEAVDSLSFDDVSSYFALPAGTYDFAIVPTGEPVENALVSVVGATIDAGAAYELAAIGLADAPQLQVNPVDLSPIAPVTNGTPLENTRIRAVHAVPGVSAVDVTFVSGGIAERVFSELAFPQVTEYVDKLAGRYRVILNPTDGEVVSIDLNEITFDGNTVYSIYALGDAASGDLRLLEVAVDLGDGTSSTRAIPPVLVSDIVDVSSFSIYQGDCTELSGVLAYELTGTGYDGAGAGTLAPWGSGGDASGALGVTPVLYGEGVLDGVNLGDLLGGRTTSVVVRDAATGGVVACGEIGGVVEKADRFWQHDRLIIGLEPVGELGISGTATFTEDTGILTDKITVSVSLTTAE